MTAIPSASRHGTLRRSKTWCGSRQAHAGSGSGASSWRLALLRLWSAFGIAVALFIANPSAAQELAPADAPIVTQTHVKLPPLPNEYVSIERSWIRLSMPEELKHWQTELLSTAEQFRTEASDRLGQEVLTRVDVRLATDASQMKTLAPPNAPYPPYAAGVAYSRLGLILLTARSLHANSHHNLKEVLRHELAHVALHDAIGGRHVPLWLNEGLAVQLSGEGVFKRTQALWTAAVSGNLLTLKELERAFPKDGHRVSLAYAQSADVVRFLNRRQEAERFRLLMSRLRRGQPFDQALSDSYGMDTYNLERAWRDNVDSRFSLWPILFSGTMIWVGAVFLAGLAWRKQKRRQKRTLARWTREEAARDALDARRKEELAAQRALQSWLVLGAPQAVRTKPPGEPGDVPGVQHDGGWHTLH